MRQIRTGEMACRVDDQAESGLPVAAVRGEVDFPFADEAVDESTVSDGADKNAAAQMSSRIAEGSPNGCLVSGKDDRLLSGKGEGEL